MSTLESKYQYFEDLKRLAKNIFKDAPQTNWSHPFTVWGGTGELDDLLDIFWGSLPYRSFVTLDNSNGTVLPKNKFVSEKGAVLRYQRLENGVIIATLHPAKSDRLSISIDYWEIGIFEDASKITESLIRQHFDLLMLVMENTTIFSEPSPSSRRKFSYFSWTHKYYEQNLLKKTKIHDFLVKSISFILPVLFSGAGLVAIQKCSAEDIQVKESNFYQNMATECHIHYCIKVSKCKEILNTLGFPQEYLKSCQNLWRCPLSSEK